MPVIDPVPAAHRHGHRVPRHRGLQRSLGLFGNVVETHDPRAAAVQGRLFGFPAEAGLLSLVDAGVRVVVLGVEGAVVLDDVVDAA